MPLIIENGDTFQKISPGQMGILVRKINTMAPALVAIGHQEGGRLEVEHIKEQTLKNKGTSIVAKGETVEVCIVLGAGKLNYRLTGT